MKGKVDSLGHTFGVRVDGAATRGLWPPGSGRLCRRVVKGKVDGPPARLLWYRPWTRPFGREGSEGSEGKVSPLRGDEYKVSVTG